MTADGGSDHLGPPSAADSWTEWRVCPAGVRPSHRGHCQDDDIPAQRAPQSRHKRQHAPAENSRWSVLWIAQAIVGPLGGGWGVQENLLIGYLLQTY